MRILQGTVLSKGDRNAGVFKPKDSDQEFEFDYVPVTMHDVNMDEIYSVRVRDVEEEAIQVGQAIAVYVVGALEYNKDARLHTARKVYLIQGNGRSN